MGSGEKITVPKGFITDGASVPSFLWGWPFDLSPWGPYAKAAVLHDWLYAEQALTKLEADNTFLEAMEALGISEFKRNVMFKAVRWFGQAAWDEHKQKGDPEKIKSGRLPEFPDVKFSDEITAMPQGG